MVLSLILDPAQAEPGTLMGKVFFKGKVPGLRKFMVTIDKEACHHAAQEVQEVFVSKDGGLAGVVVELPYIESTDGEREWRIPEEGYMLWQKDCTLAPYLLVIHDGATVTIINEDQVMHNVNTGQFNIAQAGKGKGVNEHKKRMAWDGQSLIRVNCNVHSWMESWIYIARTPFHAVTDSEGRFQIGNIPPGEHTVTVNHPTLGAMDFEVEIASGGTVEKAFTYEK